MKDIDWEGLVGMWIMMSAKYNGRVLFLLVICKYYLCASRSASISMALASSFVVPWRKGLAMGGNAFFAAPFVTATLCAFSLFPLVPVYGFISGFTRFFVSRENTLLAFRFVCSVPRRIDLGVKGLSGSKRRATVSTSPGSIRRGSSIPFQSSSASGEVSYSLDILPSVSPDLMVYVVRIDTLSTLSSRTPQNRNRNPLRPCEGPVPVLKRIVHLVPVEMKSGGAVLAPQSLYIGASPPPPNVGSSNVNASSRQAGGTPIRDQPVRQREAEAGSSAGKNIVKVK